jgi:uncharacterized protein
MGKIRLIVLDVLKPHEPSIMVIASGISDLNGIVGTDITVYEIDSKVENVKITIQGKDIVFDEVKQVIEDLGGTIHSIDKVSTGTVIVEEAQTHQDSPH